MYSVLNIFAFACQKTLLDTLFCLILISSKAFTEAALHRCSYIKKGLRKYAGNLQENTHAEDMGVLL